MFSQIKKILNKNLINKFYRLSILAFLIPIFEIFSIALILPVIKILLEKNFKYDFPLIYNYLENISLIIFSNNNFISLLIITFLLYSIFYIVRSIIIIIIQVKINNFSLECEKFLKENFFLKYINLNYIDKIKNSYSYYYSMFTTQIEFFSGNINSLMTILVESITLILIVIFLLIYNFDTTIKIILLFLIIFLIINFIFNKKLKKLSINRNEKVKKIYSNFSIILKLFKELDIFNKNKIYSSKLSYELNEYKILNLKRQTIALLPRQIFENISLIIIFSFLLINFSNYNSLNSLISNLGIYLFVIIKIIPSLSKILNSIQNLKFAKATFEEILNFSEHLSKGNHNDKNTAKTDKIIKFEKTFKLENINIDFDNIFYLKNGNIQISKNKFTSIIGKSGTGKTTLINIFLGLLENQTTSLKVDGVNHELNNDNWRKLISFVPQEVPIFKGSILENISLDVDNVDKAKIKKVLRLSELSEFLDIKNKGYNYLLEDDGKNISGGQKQRLGLARALYFNPQILFLDEFTSSLDEKTDKNILETLNKLKKDFTIIFVTHKNSILSFSDNIIEIKDKKINIIK